MLNMSRRTVALDNTMLNMSRRTVALNNTMLNMSRRTVALDNTMLNMSRRTVILDNTMLNMSRRNVASDKFNLVITLHIHDDLCSLTYSTLLICCGTRDLKKPNYRSHVSDPVMNM
jgi:hypothetical protein